MDLFTLAAKLTLDSSSFDAGLSKADKAGSGLADKLSKIGSVAKKAAAALVFKKAIDGLKSLADKAAAAGDKIDKQSQALGISRKAYQEWEYVLSQSGASIDSLGTALKTMNSKIEAGSDAVGKLGLKFEDLQGMSIEERFDAIVKAFNEMPEGAEKSALAMELFGKQGQSLMALLNSSADSVEDLKNHFHDLGIELTDKQIDAAVKYGDTMDDLNRVLEAGKIIIGSELLPALTTFAEQGVKFASKLIKAYDENGFKGVFDAIAKTIQENLPTLTEKAKTIATDIGQAISDSLPAILEGLNTVLLSIGEGLKATDSPVMQAVGEVIVFMSNLLRDPEGTISQALTDLWTGIQTTLSHLWDDIKHAAFDAWESIKGWWTENISEPVVSAWNSVLTGVSKAWDNIKRAAYDAWNAIKKWWTENISEPISKAWNNVKTGFQKAWDDIQHAASDAWNKVKEWWTENISDPVKTAWENVKTGFTTKWTEIKDKASEWFDKVKEVWTKDVSEPVGKAWESVKGALDGAWSKITQAATTAWNGFYNAVIKPIQDVIDKVKELLGLNDTKTIDVTVKYHYQYAPASGTPWNPATGQAPTVYGTQAASPHAGAGSERTGITTTHAKGDWSVPYDDYVARLHRGEMVLTASQARRYRDGEGSGMDMSALANTIVSAVREGMAGASVNSFLDGQNVTDEISRIVGEAMTARRFA